MAPLFHTSIGKVVRADHVYFFACLHADDGEFPALVGLELAESKDQRMAFLEVPGVLHYLVIVGQIRSPMNSDPVVGLAESSAISFQMMALNFNFRKGRMSVSLAVIIMIIAIMVDIIIHSWLEVFIITVDVAVPLYGLLREVSEVLLIFGF